MSVDDISKYIKDHKKVVKYSEDGDTRSEVRFEALPVSDVYELVLKLVIDTKAEQIQHPNISFREKSCGELK